MEVSAFLIDTFTGDKLWNKFEKDFPGGGSW